MLYLVIVDEFNEVLATYNPSGLTLDIRALLDFDGIRNFSKHSLHAVSTPIKYRGKSWGNLLFACSMDALDERIADNVKTTLFVSLMILLFGIASSMFFGHIITKPLKELRDAAEEIGRGNHDVVVPITTSDEVGILGTVLKDMVENILKTLSESEEKFRSMSSSAQDAIIMVDSGGFISFWNKAAERTLGYSAEEAMGKNMHRLIAPKRFIDEAQRGFAQFIQTGQGPFIGKMIEVFAIRKNGTEFTAELSLSRIKLASKWHAVCIMRDVTEQRRNESELKHLAMAINQASETVVITDAEGTITYANPAIEKISGYSIEEITGKNARIISGGEYDESFYQSFWNTISQGQTWAGRFVNRRKDGKSYTEEATVSPIYSDAGKIVSYVAVKRDITQELKHELQEKELQEKLDRAEKMESLGILAGGVAHDLNNMLGPVVGYSELILRDISKDDKLGQRVSRISKSARDAADVIQDLLTLARRGRYEMCPIDLNEVIKSYVDSPGHQQLVEVRADILFKFDLDPSLSRINGSPPHLSKVIMNLVVNACDAMRDGGELSVSTSQQHLEALPGGHENIPSGDYIILRAQDTGMGIDPKDIDKIFEPYYSKKKMGSSGSGLGLSVVYGVVKDHKGYYDIFSEVGIGTEFVLYFPMTNDKVIEEPAKKLDIRGDQKILIVDDIKEQLQVTKDILLNLGYKVNTIHSGQAAVQFLKTDAVDLIIMDMILGPDYDGLDTYRDIRKLYPHQKCVIVSGYSITERVTEMQSLGAGQCLRKPFTVEILGTAVRRELDKIAEPAL